MRWRLLGRMGVWLKCGFEESFKGSLIMLTFTM